ncbi:MAG TPA: protein kinase [Trichormus sp.]
MDTSGLLDNTPLRILAAASALTLQHANREPERDGNFAVCNGEVLAGRYRVISTLGHGGTGTVYKVEQIFLRHNYALKLLSAPLALTNAEARFHKEAKACHYLNHRNLVKVHDFDLLHDNRPFLVMDLCEGPTLADLLKHQGSLPVERTLDLFIQICDGLACAHENGVVHRDLKPNNIIIINYDGNDLVKIVDFGIAKIIEGETIDNMALTRTGEIFGTPLYMSPEQCMSKAVDHRSDIYSIGCALFETLAGVPPFLAENTLMTMMKHQSEMPSTLREASLGKQFPSDLERVVFKLLAKDPDQRYQSITGAKAHLERVRANQPIKWDMVEVKTTAKAKWNLPGALSALFFGIGFGTVLMGFMWARWLFTHNEFNPKISTGCTDMEVWPSAPSLSTTSKFSMLDLKDWGDQPMVLHFPKQSLGRVFPVLPGAEKYIIEYDGAAGKDASGDVTFARPAPLAVKPAWPGIDPRLLRRFRSDEVFALNMRGDTDIDDDSLVFIGQLTGLRALNLADDVEVTNRAIDFIQKLPNLSQLDISWTQIDGGGLSKFSRLNKLSYLSINRIAAANKVLPALEHSLVEDLHIQGCDLTDKDMVHIGRCDRLERLFMAENTKVTAAGYAELAHLKHLRCLDIRDTFPTVAILSCLARLPLRNLEVSAINDNLVKVLTGSESINNLTFSHCDSLTDKGIGILVKMKHLHSINLADTAATPGCIADLKRLPELESITINQEWFKQISKHEIKAQLPNCTIKAVYL